MRHLSLAFLCVFPVLAPAQQSITIQVDASRNLGQFKPVWNYFGYDEPNYTYAKNGQKLIHELADLSYTPVHIRTHFLLASGNGTPGLKWGSTNAYTEDPSGKSVYNWTIIDKILGTYVQAGVTPFVEIGFMPQALSSHPDPYTPTWIPGGKNDNYNIGWTYPPRDYQKWHELIYRWVTHCVEEYGRRAVETWDWEVWNEPNIGYWHGTPEEYDELYDYTAAAVKRALPSARVGGPASTGPDNAKAGAFLQQFLRHCVSGKNAATGGQGAPLDFISFHAKGRPKLVGRHVQMGVSQEMKDTARGFEIVRSFPKFSNVPIVISEADPEGCAACSARVYPQNAYRNGTLYPAYEAVTLKTLIALAARDHMNLEGILTWAFEFEDQPYFAGFRTLATNGVDKPVLNFFRMLGLMRGDLINVKSSGAVPADTIVKTGVAQGADIDALAARTDRNISVMVWHYCDDDVTGSPAQVDLKITGLPSDRKRLLMRHYRIDQDHSNSYTLWKQMGSPQNPTADQYGKLEAAGHLQLWESPRWVESRTGSEDVNFSLPLQAISLIELSW
ncbi:MAG: beta-xylosidase [Acidobacteriaceae bacterium]|nr:beta-xylosidase [Acidobacteriaceae bacterium]